ALSTPSADHYTDGVNVAVTLDFVRYRNSDGTFFTAYPELAGNALYVYRTVPTVVVHSPSSSLLINGFPTNLVRWKLGASPAGPLAYKKITFGLSWSDFGEKNMSELRNLRLFRDGKDISRRVSIVAITQGKSGSSSADFSVLQLAIVFREEEMIFTGTSHEYILRGIPYGFGFRDRVAIYLQGDELPLQMEKYLTKPSPDNLVRLAPVAGMQYATTQAKDANFIWSDLSSLYHAPKASGPIDGGDWINGHLVEGLNDVVVVVWEAFKEYFPIPLPSPLLPKPTSPTRDV
ncbi:MAG: hypothetical protein HYV78_01825, partial [Candidatus Wildermuthbacteria bacterium]|nr:hypothetical protein [Candidatus Wildermuthbacteria bacterium]